MSAFGGTLKRLRTEAGMSLRELAARLGVSSAYLSRVEHGLDAAPRPERIEALAAELGVPPAMLLEVGHRASPLLSRYIEQEPSASALFLAIAQRGLTAKELAELKEHVETRFRHETATRAPTTDHRLAPLLAEDRVVLGLHCEDVDDACDVGAARVALVPGMPDRARLSRAFRERLDDVEPSIGSGLAVLFAEAPDAPRAAGLVVLATELETPTVDEVPVRAVVLLTAPMRGRDTLVGIAHVARLGARGLASTLARPGRPADIIERIAALEA